jgi:tetratricopeptide (TPR) repeat protein
MVKLKNYQHPIMSSLGMLFLVCLIVFEASGQANNVITGFVFGIEQRPLSDVSVELLDENSSLLSRMKTDGGGRYMFTRLRRARYYVQVSPIASDYEGQTKEVEISGISRGGAADAGADTIQQNFNLRSRKSGSQNLAINAVVFAQEIPKEAEKLYGKAISALKNKKTDEAIADLQKALEILPTYYLALEKLGEEYISRQKYTEAFEVLSKAVEVNPKGFSGQYSLGYTLYQLKKYPEALEAVQKSVEIAPNSVNGIFLLGVSLKQIGRYEEAAENLKKAAKLSPSPQPDIHWQLSLIYTNNLKKYEEAAEQLELFLKAKPDYEEAEKVKALIKKLKAKG